MIWANEIHDDKRKFQVSLGIKHSQILEQSSQTSQEKASIRKTFLLKTQQSQIHTWTVVVKDKILDDSQVLEIKYFNRDSNWALDTILKQDKLRLHLTQITSRFTPQLTIGRTDWLLSQTLLIRTTKQWSSSKESLELSIFRSKTYKYDLKDHLIVSLS